MANLPLNSSELNFFCCPLNDYRFWNAKLFCALKLNVSCLCLDEYYLYIFPLCPFSILRFKTTISPYLHVGNFTNFSFCVAKILKVFQACSMHQKKKLPVWSFAQFYKWLEKILRSHISTFVWCFQEVNVCVNEKRKETERGLSRTNLVVNTVL